MGFDRELASELLDERDRDTARFFAGRGEEIQRFDAAVRESRRSKQAVFRIYQGAPGCGKTSLVDRLRQIRSEDVLFVDIEKEHLAGKGPLASRVRDAATAAGPAGAKVASIALKAIGTRLGIQTAGNALGAAVLDKAIDKTEIVLHMDEAQLIDGTEQLTLVSLHTHGLGVPTVCLFTGLGHTARQIGSIEGLSRLGENVTVNMGAMSDAECAESTRMMLDELRTVGSESEKDRFTKMVATLSYGWPQHLHCAQQALCRELQRTDGALGKVSAARVREESDRRRTTYYEGRLDGTVLADWPELTAAIVAGVIRERPSTTPALTKLCRDEVGRQGLGDDPDFDATPKGFAATLVERGVLAVSSDRRYDVAIPSMARWLEGVSPPSAT